MKNGRQEMTDFLWPLCRMTLWTISLWMLLILILLAGEGHTERVFLPNHKTCATHIIKYEQHHRIPNGLLHAISKAESGLKDVKGKIVAWPWTVNAQGQGYFFPTKQAAIAAVKQMQARGIKSIDVGCMQVNLYHHPEAFKNLDKAFEPSENVKYAALFLKRLQKESNSWSKAVAHYHSVNPVHHVPYQKTVLRIWNRDKRGGGNALASAIFAEDFTAPPETHIRRLSSAKTLRLTPVSRHTLGYSRRGGSSSHIRRLKLSK